MAAQATVCPHLASDTCHLGRKGAQLIDHRVDGVLELQDLAAHGDRYLLREIPLRHRGRHFRDIPDLGRQVAAHHVDAVCQVLPSPSYPLNVRLPPESPFGANLPDNTCHLRSEGAQLIDHRIDRVLQLQDLALDIDGDLLRQIAVGHRFGDLGDVPHLGGEVASHEIHAIGQVLPRAGHPLNVRLAAQLPFGANLPGDAGDFRGERPQLINHRVNGVLELQDLAAHVDGDLLREITFGYGGRDIGDVPHLCREVSRHRVHAVGQIFPGARHALHVGLAA